MISERIEKAILNGWARYEKINHAFGSFGSVLIPKGHTAIIVDIKWNHFFNPLNDDLGRLKIKDIMKYSEYTLKIDGRKSKNYLIFKNIIDITITNPNLIIDLDAQLSTYIDDFKKYVLVKHSLPIIQDVFFVCENYINLSITRNEFINNIATDFTTLNPLANQPNIPVGLGDLNVLKNSRMQSIGGIDMLYRPPSIPYSNPNTLGTFPQTMETYSQPLDKQSVMTDIKGSGDYIYYTHPLVELGIVLVNENNFDKIANQ